MRQTSIISVNSNQPLVTIEHLKSVTEPLKWDNIKSILVGNGDNENYQNVFAQTYPVKSGITSEKKPGIAGVNYLGIKASAEGFLLFRNNDRTDQPKRTIFYFMKS